MTRHYLAGPMTGYSKFNFPLFDAAAKWLRERHVDVVSPAELDEGPVREAAYKSEKGSLADIPNSHTYGDLLARDVKLIADTCKGIILLPHWEKSKGARLEAYVGLLVGAQFQTLAVIENHDTAITDPEHYQFRLYPADTSMIRDAIYISLGGDPRPVSELDAFAKWLDVRWGDGGYSKDPTKAIAVQALGLAGETGEVIEHFKKHIRDGAPLHTTPLKLELGDAFHYWMRLVQAAGFTPSEVMAANIQKLEARDLAKTMQARQIEEACK